ncbi:tRNA pseudouridine(38-40) synthase TruA [Sulfurimonas autotrophica]|uniref:tRNA pseudouridine synthase A n=1 Tax=Sulfurimonas autotrophica (strain ATCC BAA-671 / DSM 16294 / JCM 11897 / OK10) TaxID=563040 RepID=E0UTH1_SULAO|nr:tRNA pseudouridine(38-40) synthase TruA [Sulfurimonas autotrophica]ADN09336.1 tRNA pseudouridine synthase A [Sulfurimonas autotrophica DSM 16294]
MRVALHLAYNGTHFFGSQTQKETSKTVLGELENVLKKLGIEQKVIASGRTDKGVHATMQVCHIDLPPYWEDTQKLKRVLNEMLNDALHVKRIRPVSDDFHARYSAKKRTYRYIIKTTQSNPFEKDFVTFLKDINFENIQENIALFVGKHDFKQFMKTGSEVKSTTRIIYKAFAYKYKDYVVLNFQANGFLRSQIRLMVGALLSLNAQQIQEQLNCSNNYKIKPAPANGLYLSTITY